ncbi:MAG: hypothetical protein OET79_12995 [Nitrospirota bacterium]|nr:hypothetical protein [Nitrospirota bacterium]
MDQHYSFHPMVKLITDLGGKIDWDRDVHEWKEAKKGTLYHTESLLAYYGFEFVSEARQDWEDDIYQDNTPTMPWGSGI